MAEERETAIAEQEAARKRQAQDIVEEVVRLQAQLFDIIDVNGAGDDKTLICLLDEEVPPTIKEVDGRQHDFELDGWVRWDMPSEDYYDVFENREAYTAYDGGMIWSFIHNKICFRDPGVTSRAVDGEARAFVVSLAAIENRCVPPAPFLPRAPPFAHAPNPSP